MLSPEANLILTALLTAPEWGKMEICEQLDHRIAVWLPRNKTFDAPDGVGDSLAEALEMAAEKSVRR